MPGCAESGDRYVCHITGDAALFAVIDGVGHGAQAAAAAKQACAVLQANAEENVIALMARCHDRLRSTRGAAISMASFNFKEGLLTWLGVGNVQGVLLPAGSLWSDKEDSLFQRPGLVGSNLPRLQATVVPVSAGDSIVFWTDGIESSFDRTPARSHPPQRAAEMILERHARRTDDALILIARFNGNQR